MALTDLVSLQAALDGLDRIWQSAGLIVRNSSTYFTIGLDSGAPSAAEPNGSTRTVPSATTNATTRYTRVNGAWVAEIIGRDFGSTGVTADVIAESTAAAGVTIDGLLLKDGSVQPGAITDPGNAGAIAVTKSGYCPLVSAGAETRTLAAPSFIGQRILLYLKTDGGDCVVTVATGINQTGNNTITFNDAGDTVELVAKENGANKRWTLVVNDGAALSTV